MTSNERAQLRRAANGMRAIFQIGKESMTDQLVTGIDQALAVRELVKVAVLPAALMNTRVTADAFAKLLKAEVVQVIGSRFILYRRNPELNRYGIE